MACIDGHNPAPPKVSLPSYSQGIRQALVTLTQPGGEKSAWQCEALLGWWCDDAAEDGGGGGERGGAATKLRQVFIQGENWLPLPLVFPPQGPWLSHQAVPLCMSSPPCLEFTAPPSQHISLFLFFFTLPTTTSGTLIFLSWLPHNTAFIELWDNYLFNVSHVTVNLEWTEELIYSPVSLCTYSILSCTICQAQFWVIFILFPDSQVRIISTFLTHWSKYCFYLWLQ